MNDIVIVLVFSVFLAAIGYLAWKVRKLQIENVGMLSMLASVSNLVYELSKMNAIFQKNSLDQEKAIKMIAAYEKENKEEFFAFKKEVNAFAALVARQISVSSGTQKGDSKNIFGPAKKNDKIKPN